MVQTTATRRGLALTAYSEIVVVIGLVAFILWPTRATILVVAILLSLLFGAPAGLAFWTGRREFGPKQERSVRWTILTFMVLFACLLLAFFQVNSVFPDSMRLRDLYGPFAFLALALAADATAMIVLLTPLLPSRRGLLLSIGGLAFVGLAFYLMRGIGTMQDLIERSGGVAAVPAEATSYVRDFVTTIVREWAIALLALRLAFWPALYYALSGVAEAERDWQERAAA